MNQLISVVPSLPARSFEELRKLADALRGTAPELQVDIVDGSFVAARSWPFTESEPREALGDIQALIPDFSIEMDCMVMQPEQYLDTFSDLGIARVVIHVGSTEEYADCVAHARAHGYRIGIAFTNDVPESEYAPLIAQFDFVQVMGIREVGVQGQPFDERTLATIRAIRSAHPEHEIAVDGSVNADTMVALKDAGANRFAPGSAVARADDPCAAYLHLRALVA